MISIGLTIDGMQPLSVERLRLKINSLDVATAIIVTVCFFVARTSLKSKVKT